MIFNNIKVVESFVSVIAKQHGVGVFLDIIVVILSIQNYTYFIFESIL